jgi:hypothetical protein
MKQLAENLWVYEQPHVMLGVNAGARMTVVRDENGAVWLHSPIDTAQLREEIAALGPVRAIVAPNQGHFQGIKEASATFPEAEIFAVPDVAARIEMDVDLPEESAGAGILARRLRGSRVFDETVFLHVPSKTLILTDLCMNLQRLSKRERIIARLLGIPPRFGTTRFTKLFARDRDAMRTAAHEMISWDFDRVIISHGDLIETGGKAIMRRALAWL